MMTEQITIRVRPGEAIRFPAVCVSCGHPAQERLKMHKRRGQVTRSVDAPLCAECARQLARASGREERLLRLSWFAAVALGLLLAVVTFIALPPILWPVRLAVAAVAGLAGGALVRWAVARRAATAELPEKRAVREAAQIVDFTWRDMTIAFTNDEIAGRVREINETAVVAKPDETLSEPPE